MRTILFATAAVAAVAPAAAAKPLPAGMKVVVVKQRPMVKQGAFTVPLFDDDEQGQGATIKASLTDDGTSIHAVWDRCGMGGENEYDVPLAHVTARLENYAGMAAHLKKKYADAMPHFAAAIAANPDEPMYQTNLLSAQSMSGKLDDADKTLATWGPKNRAWFVWRLAVDKELAAVKDRPSAKALRAATPGKVKALSLVSDAAIAGDLVATIENEGNGGPGSPYDEDLVVFDAAAGRQLLRMPVVTEEDMCADGVPDDAPDGEVMRGCTPKLRAKQAADAAEADDLLAALGFAIVPKARATQWGAVNVVSSPDGKVKVDFGAAPPAVTVGGKTFAADDPGHIYGVVFVGTHVLFENSERHIYLCDDDSFRVDLVPATPATTP
jgi:hypothetical protein